VLYREIVAVCSEIHTKHITVLWGQNVELLNVTRDGDTVTTWLRRAKHALTKADAGDLSFQLKFQWA